MNISVINKRYSGKLKDNTSEGYNTFTIQTPEEFSFEECLAFLERSSDEVLHVINNGRILKLLEIKSEFVLIRLNSGKNLIEVEVLNHTLNKVLQAMITNFIKDWFDLRTELKPFYILGKQDKVMKNLINQYYGLRIIGIPNLFEAISWAIIGQHINLRFAYILKKRFVKKYGLKFLHKGSCYYMFPSSETVAPLEIDDLTKLQFTRKKAEYIIDISKMILNGYLSREMFLQEKEIDKVMNKLLQIKGVGNWTANYVIMKCLNYKSAFPSEDVGLHNAIRIQYKHKLKPTTKETKILFKNWAGWEAYATFYFWRSLI
jgi:DNA-3-methyladenine glycosylase II